MRFIELLCCPTYYLPGLPDVFPVLVTQFGLLVVAAFIYYFSTKSKKSNTYNHPFKPIYKTLDVLGQERSSIVYNNLVSFPQSNKIHPLWVRILIGILILIFIATPIIFH